MKTDFKTWSRKNLERFAREAADELEKLTRSEEDENKRNEADTSTPDQPSEGLLHSVQR